jgi:hypothetical protein
VANAEVRGRLALLCLLGVAAPVLAAMPFTSTQDSFVALFPRPPYIEARTVAVGSRTNASVRMYRVDEARTEWLVSATDISGLTMDVPRTLAGARDGLVAKSGGSVASEKAVRIAKYDGLALRLDRPDASIVMARLCVTPLRIYEALVVTTEEPARHSEIQRFLDSFSPE